MAKEGGSLYEDLKHVQLLAAENQLEYEPDLSDTVTDKAIVEDKKKRTLEHNSEAYRKEHGQRLQHINSNRGVQWFILALLASNLANIREEVKPFSTGRLN